MAIFNEYKGRTVEYPIPELAGDTQAYRQYKKANAWDTFGDIITGEDEEPDKDRQALIEKYHELLTRLDMAQKELAIEVEKTGRVAQTNYANLIAQFARVRAATEEARGGVKSARTRAAQDMVEYYSEDRARFGAKSTRDLGKEELDSVGKIVNLTSNGRVTDTAAFMSEVNSKIKELSARDPTLIVPYLRSIQDKTTVDLTPIFMRQAAGKDLGNTYGIQSDLILDTAKEANFGITKHTEGIQYNQERDAQILSEVSNMANDMGWEGGEVLARDLKAALTFAPEILTQQMGVSTSGDVIAIAPPEDSPFEERKAWVQKALDGKAELREDGKVYEIDENAMNMAPGLQSIPYGTAAKIYGRPGAYKALLANAGPRFIQDTRKRITDMIDQLQVSELPIHVAIRNNIVRSPEYKSWATDRGYYGQDGKPAIPQMDIFRMYMREFKAAGGQRGKLTKNVQIANTAFNPEVPATEGQRKRAVRQAGRRGITGYGETTEQPDAGLDYDDPVNSNLDPAPGSTITAGASGPDKAAQITEESAARGDTGKAAYKEFLDYNDVANGREPWKYRVHDDGNIEVVGKPGDSNVSAEKPITVKPGSTAYKSIAAMAHKPEAQAIVEAADMGSEEIEQSEKATETQGVLEQAEALDTETAEPIEEQETIKPEPKPSEPQEKKGKKGIGEILKGIRGPPKEDTEAGKPDKQELGRQERLKEIESQYGALGEVSLTPEQIARRQRRLKLLQEQGIA